MEKPKKLTGWELYRDVMKSPKRIVAPMVDQSELAWRVLSRRYGAEVVYTPMINAKIFADSRHNSTYRLNAFNTETGEEGGPEDRPLFIQFAANDPAILLEAAKMLEGRCNAIDINFGCPQDIARRGRYGAYLCDDWDLIYKLINTLHENLSIPVTAKFRVFPEVEKTVKYAQMMERAGAQILTCHGRTREQRGHKSGLADWSQIAAVKKAVSVPVFANGNVLYESDVQKCLDVTGADAYMSAEPQLHNPAIFSSTTPHPFHADLALEYLRIVKGLKTPTAPSAIKAHLFKLMHPALPRETDLRDRLGKVGGKEPMEVYEAICGEMKMRMERDAAAAGWDASDPNAHDFVMDPTTRLRNIPHWLAQPRVRPPPPPPSAKQLKALEKSKGKQDVDVVSAEAEAILVAAEDIADTKVEVLVAQTPSTAKRDATEAVKEGDSKRQKTS